MKFKYPRKKVQLASYTKNIINSITSVFRTVQVPLLSVLLAKTIFFLFNKRGIFQLHLPSLVKFQN